MKTKRFLVIFANVALLGMMVSCKKDRYNEGFAAGQAQGYAEGYDVGYADGYFDGDADGYERAKLYFASPDYLQGFADGKNEGLSIGYANGYTVGKQDGTVLGYNSGYSDGKADGKYEGYNLGYNDGYGDGYDDGYATVDYNAYNNGYSAGYSDGNYDGYQSGYSDGNYDGYNLGYNDGSSDGYDFGYGDGFNDGYDIGYDDGFSDGYWTLSVGKTKALKGYANILSMAHNDLFDYSKIKAPKQTKRGLVANGKLIFSEESLTNKDTLKKAAVVEQYLVVEMAKQVQGKFGLSSERSLKIAKASNHFRKFSTKRAFTKEDTDAYAQEIVGTDFTTMAKAFEESKKGDLSAFGEVIEKAASKNEVSPEKMTEIVTQLFI